MISPKTFQETFDEICNQDGPLVERLDALTNLIERTDPSFAEAYAVLIAQLRAVDAGRKAPGVGDRMPPFLLPDQFGRLVDSHRLLERGPLVVSFNRGHWCEYCELELRTFAAAHEHLASLGANIVSIMPERAEYTRLIADRVGHAFPLLSDMDNAYALELSLVVWLGKRIVTLLRNAGLDLELFQGNGMWFVPIPATFVVGVDGLIVARLVDPDFRKRMAIEQIRAALARSRSSG